MPLGVTRARLGYTSGPAETVGVRDVFFSLRPRTEPVLKTITWLGTGVKPRTISSSFPADAARDQCSRPTGHRGKGKYTGRTFDVNR